MTVELKGPGAFLLSWKRVKLPNIVREILLQLRISKRNQAKSLKKRKMQLHFWNFFKNIFSKIYSLLPQRNVIRGFSLLLRALLFDLRPGFERRSRNRRKHCWRFVYKRARFESVRKVVQAQDPATFPRYNLMVGNKSVFCLNYLKFLSIIQPQNGI